MIALLDWDNTIRDGYSICDWLEYLINKKVVDINIMHIFKQFATDYANGVISHDVFAKYFAYSYCQSLKGISEDTIINLIDEYLLLDQKKLFLFTTKLFEFFSNNAIKIIVITGAPSLIIRQYQKKYKFKEVFGLEPEVLNGKYTGLVFNNYGFNKEKTVLKLKSSEQDDFIGFGDSESDRAIIENSRFSFVIGNSDFSSVYNNHDSVNKINRQDSFQHIKSILIKRINLSH